CRVRHCLNSPISSRFLLPHAFSKGATMKIAAQILITLAAVGLFVAGALWGSHSVVSAQSSAGNPVKVQDGTNNTYFAEVTSFKALKVDGSAITQPIA